MTEEHKAPYETPDAVISMGLQTYGRPKGFKRLHRLVSWSLGKLKWKLPMQTIMVRVVFRDYRERVEVVQFPVGTVQPFVEKLLEKPQVRQVYVAELLFKGRKSFGADYDPNRWDEFFVKAAKSAADETPTAP